MTTAPPVVAVVVARDPGPCFEEALAAFGKQDYPNLSVLVVDAGSRVDPAPRVAATLPEAYVRRIDEGGGFAVAANDALRTVEGAAFLLFCRDDAAPEPDAVRRLVEEAIRSNAGVVGPKIVERDRPSRLVDVGLAVDKTGAWVSLAERGELDQAQHDGVRDVFAVSSTCMLVRGDLFEVIGGFDPEMTDHGADVDLCWRAQVAGARVLVAPAARVRHPGHEEGTAAEERRRVALEHRNHLRSMFKNYSVPHVARILPQALVLTVGEILFALVRRRFADAGDLIRAWLWNLRSVPRLRAARQAVRRSRAVPDTDVRRLQVRGSVRVTFYFQRQLHADDRAQALVSAGQELVGAVARGPAQVATALLAVLTVAWLVGIRHLVTGPLPAVGEFAPLPGPTSLLAHWVSGWRSTGMGAAAAAPTAFAWLGLSGVVLLGKMALLQKLLVLGAWPVAAFGVWRLTSVFPSTLARLVTLLVYAAVPLPYDSLARGRFGGLVAYATLPWLIGALLRASRLEPWDKVDEADAGPSRWRRGALGAALGLALAASLSPPVAIAFLLAAVGLVVGCLVGGGVAGGLRAAGLAFTAAALAALLLFPWSLEVLLPGLGWSTAAGVAPDPSGAAGLGELLRFEVGPMGAAPLGWAVLVAAALPLAIARGWRLQWAIRMWTVAVGCVLVAWAGGRGWIPLHLEVPDPLLVPAALAFAVAAGLGAGAFDTDLPGYRFGWRQLASVVAGLAVVANALPMLAGARDGRYRLTEQAAVRSLSWMGAQAAEGGFRVLWVGSAEALPLDGWPLGEGVAFATSRDGAPTFVEQLPGRPSGATRSIADALHAAERGDTARLGHLLAPMAIRYVVLPTRLATGLRGPAQYPLPPTLTRALASQVDLRVRPSDPALTVYENTAWAPLRALLSKPLEAPPDELDGGADLKGAAPVLFSTRASRARGPVPAPGTVLVAEAPSGAWSLEVEGRAAARRPAFGVANLFVTERSGAGVLRYRTPILHSVLLTLQLALWVLALRALLRLRRRPAPIETPRPPDPERVPVGASPASQ